MARPGIEKGVSLLELLIGMFLSALLIAGVTSLLGNSVSSYRQQLSLGQMEESSRFALQTLKSHISQAGYQPRPWQTATGLEAVTGESANGGALPGDTLGLQRWSKRNCYGNENPVRDGAGNPEFHLLQIRFRVTRANNLAMTCRYGPHTTQLTTQVNNLGLVGSVESMQVLYAEDRNDDGVADGWVPAGDWKLERHVLAVKLALLFKSDRAIRRAATKTITLLDESVTPPPDGHLRSVSILTTAIRGRLP